MPEVSNIEKLLINILLETCKKVGFVSNGKNRIQSTGSFQRGTSIVPEFDFDISIDDSVNLNLLEKKLVQFELQNTLINELKKMKFNHFQIFIKGFLNQKSLFLVSIEKLSHATLPQFSFNVDFVLHLQDRLNIAIINHKVLQHKYKHLKKSYGSDRYEILLGEIRFTKWFLKRKYAVVDLNENPQSSKSSVIISSRNGFISVMIELALVELAISQSKSRLNGDSKSYDVLFRYIYNADKSYRLSHPKKNYCIIPISKALQDSLICSIRRDMVIDEAEKMLMPEEKLSDYLRIVDRRILTCFEDNLKWFTFVKIARDYFENNNFMETYGLTNNLGPLHNFSLSLNI